MDAQLRDNAQKMLDALEDGGIDVIREMGIKGVAQHDRFCLVAKYLNRTVGGRWSVGSHAATDVDYDASVNVRLPNRVQALIREFDNGAYPDLELPEEGF